MCDVCELAEYEGRNVSLSIEEQERDEEFLQRSDEVMAEIDIEDAWEEFGRPVIEEMEYEEIRQIKRFILIHGGRA